MIYLCRWTWPTGQSRTTSRWSPRTTRCYRVSRPTGSSRCTWWATLVICITLVLLFIFTSSGSLVQRVSAFVLIKLSGIQKCPTTICRHRNIVVPIYCVINYIDKFCKIARRTRTTKKLARYTCCRLQQSRICILNKAVQQLECAKLHDQPDIPVRSATD